MPPSAPRLTREDTPEGPCMRLLGRWSAADIGSRKRWPDLRDALAAAPVQAGLAWNLSGVQWLDHVGAQLLWNHWGRRWPEQVALNDNQRSMLERVASLSTAAAPPQRWSLSEQIDSLGARVVDGLDHLRDFVVLMGQLVLDLLRVLRAPHRAPWRDVSGHLFRMGATALPITALVGFLIGVVLAYLMSLQLRQFGAEAFIVNILGVSLIRELGPMLAAILVAGRSGSAITAQIGVMRVTEELDAMSVMGIRQGFRLVMPRTIALAIAMPLLSVWTTLAALAGGMLAADAAMNVSPAYFIQALPAAVSMGNLVLALTKSVVFGSLIALVGCHWGLRIEPNTQSLGAGTTASVVSAITVVILVDAVFAIAFKSVGF